MTSSAASSSRSGSRPGRRLASIVLPAPGGPLSRRWCPPAAAISTTCRPAGWPRTSARSGGGGRSSTGASGGSAHAVSRRSARTTVPRSAAQRTSTPGTSAASAAAVSATTTPRTRCRSAATSGTMPRTGRRAPSSPSSATSAQPSVASAGTSPVAVRTPMAMARSSEVPSLGNDDGARLMVSRRIGHWYSLEATAARTRSRASRHEASGRPTIVKVGRPLPTWTSTRTGRPSTPSNEADWMMASTARLPGTAPSGRWGRSCADASSEPEDRLRITLGQEG